MDVRANRFLEGFSAAGRERLIGHLIYQELVDGEYLFREGDSAEGVCLVLQGEVEIVKTAGGQVSAYIARATIADPFSSPHLPRIIARRLPRVTTD